MQAIELINNAWYLSGTVARGLQTSSGSDSADGLRLLNQVLSNKSISGRLLPYYDHTTFNAVVGQETYVIPNLIDLEVLTFNIGTVRYPMIRTNRNAYFGSPRVDDIKSLPFHFNFERSIGGGTISLYFTPSDAFEMRVTGKFAFAQLVDVNEPLPANIEQFYSEYLEYQLSKKMCQWKNVEWPQDKEAHLRTLYRQMLDLSAPDMTMTKYSMLRRGGHINYGYANLGTGWSP